MTGDYCSQCSRNLHRLPKMSDGLLYMPVQENLVDLWSPSAGFVMPHCTSVLDQCIQPCNLQNTSDKHKSRDLKLPHLTQDWSGNGHSSWSVDIIFRYQK